MRKTLILGLVVLATAACSKEEPAAEPAAAEPEPAAAEPKAPEPEPTKVAEFDAKQTYQTVCANCHGAQGGGDGPAGQALNPQPAAFNSAEFWDGTKDKEYIMKVVEEGGAAVGKSPMMAAYGGQYTDEQIAEIAEVVLSFKPSE